MWVFVCVHSSPGVYPADSQLPASALPETNSVHCYHGLHQERNINARQERASEARQAERQKERESIKTVKGETTGRRGRKKPGG